MNGPSGFLPGARPEPGALAALGVPPGLARLARDEAKRVGTGQPNPGPDYNPNPNPNP